MHSQQQRSDMHKYTASNECLKCTASNEGLTCTASNEGLTCTANNECLTHTASNEGLTCTASNGLTCTASNEGLTCTASNKGLTCTEVLLLPRLGPCASATDTPKMVDKLANDQITNYSQSKHVQTQDKRSVNVTGSKCSQSKHVQTQDKRSVNVTSSKCSQSKHVQTQDKRSVNVTGSKCSQSKHTKRSVKMKSSNGFRTPSPEAPLVPVPQLKNPTKSTHHVAHWTVKIRKMLARVTIRKYTTQWDQVYFSPQNFQRDKTIRSQFLVILHQIMCYYH